MGNEARIERLYQEIAVRPDQVVDYGVYMQLCERPIHFSMEGFYVKRHLYELLCESLKLKKKAAEGGWWSRVVGLIRGYEAELFGELFNSVPLSNGSEEYIRKYKA